MLKRRALAGIIGLWIAARASLAQTSGRVHRIGVLTLSTSGSDVAHFEAEVLLAGLRSAGYEEGRNLRIEWRFAEGDVSRLRALAQELVHLEVELIMAITNDPIEAAMRATQRIPIVMVGAALPVELGYVRSLARPGGNVTGTSWAAAELSGKVLQILREAVPGAKRIGFLGNPRSPGTQLYRAENRRAAAALGMSLFVADVDRAADLKATLQRLAASRPQALFVTGEGILNTQLGEIVAFANRQRLLAIGVTPQFVRAGGALYYGPDVEALVQRSASFVDRIFKGARPADLPVELPAKFDLIVNQRALKAIGVSLPVALLQRADEVIE